MKLAKLQDEKLYKKEIAFLYASNKQLKNTC